VVVEVLECCRRGLGVSGGGGGGGSVAAGRVACLGVFVGLWVCVGWVGGLIITPRRNTHTRALYTHDTHTHTHDTHTHHRGSSGGGGTPGGTSPPVVFVVGGGDGGGVLGGGVGEGGEEGCVCMMGRKHARPPFQQATQESQTESRTRTRLIPRHGTTRGGKNEKKGKTNE
jgi:ABC-type nickel/cobalt efflux system permease component RcnA